jgi:hypothetical protein
MGQLGDRYGRLFELHGEPPGPPGQAKPGRDYTELIESVPEGKDREALQSFLGLMRRYKAKAWVKFHGGGCYVGIEPQEGFEAQNPRAWKQLRKIWLKALPVMVRYGRDYSSFN